jgi:hypothetical protein
LSFIEFSILQFIASGVTCHSFFVSSHKTTPGLHSSACMLAPFKKCHTANLMPTCEDRPQGVARSSDFKMFYLALTTSQSPLILKPENVFTSFQYRVETSHAGFLPLHNHRGSPQQSDAGAHSGRAKSSALPIVEAGKRERRLWKSRNSRGDHSTSRWRPSLLVRKG